LSEKRESRRLLKKWSNLTLVEVYGLFQRGDAIGKYPSKLWLSAKWFLTKLTLLKDIILITPRFKYLFSIFVQILWDAKSFVFLIFVYNRSMSKKTFQKYKKKQAIVCQKQTAELLVSIKWSIIRLIHFFDKITSFVCIGILHRFK
jgi:hypothetical protein